jgi:phage gp29-like protein
VVAPARLRLFELPEVPRVPITGTQARSLPRDASVDHPGFGCTPQRLVGIFRDAEAGRLELQCELFDDVVETDGHLRNLFEQRTQAVAGKPRVFKPQGPGPDDAAAATALTEALAPLPMTEVLEHLLGFNRYGYACAEIGWDVRPIAGRDWIVPVSLTCVPPRRFAIVPQTDEIRLINNPRLWSAADAESLWPGRWLVIKRSSIRLARSGLMRTAAWYALYKRFATRDWVVYAEKFGIPLPIVSYTESNDDKAKNVAHLIAENIGNDGAAVVPKGIDVELVDASRGSDSSSTHGGLITHCNREVSKLVNGSTLTNDNGDSGGASYALGDVHASVRWEAVQWDAARLQEAVQTQLAIPFCVYNGLDPRRPPLLQIQVVRDLDPKVRMEMAEKALANGMPLSLSQMRQETGFAAPLDEADTLKPTATGTPAAAPGKRATKPAPLVEEEP